MIHSNIVEQAKQGDASAIATLMNQYFQPQGITAKASLTQGSLQIILESEQVPDRAKVIPFIRQELSTWQPKSVTLVRVGGRQNGDEFPVWEETLSLGSRLNAAELLTTLRTFKFDSVVPYKDIFSSELYANNTVKLLLFFGLFPLAISLITNEENLQQTAWLLGIYYATIWGVILYELIQPVSFSWRKTLQCVIFTAFVGIPLLLFAQGVPIFQLLYAAIESDLGLIPRWIGFVFGVGVLEELCKALPLYLFLIRPGYLKEPLTGAFYGAMSGLGFAIAEGGSYSLQYAMGLVEGELGLSSYVLTNTIRFISLPLFHAMLAGTVGYFLGLAAINRTRQAPIVLIGVAIAATIHGSYNTFSDSWIGFTIIAFSISLFVSYLRQSKQMVAQMQQAELGYQALPATGEDNTNPQA
jgi:protease PrsW